LEERTYAMGIIERKQRLRTYLRIKILNAALSLAKKEGWQALSMRRMAESIEYTTPVLYEYFDSKDGLLKELTKLGFVRLVKIIAKVEKEQTTPEQKLESMWMAYWEFAMADKELYQLMFGVGTGCFMDSCADHELIELSAKMQEVIREAFHIREDRNAWVTSKYCTYWSAVHGLIALAFIHREGTTSFNRELLLTVLKRIAAEPFPEAYAVSQKMDKKMNIDKPTP
jgi:AcrR family transcriptional regulator